MSNNDNSGVLFKNAKKREGKSDADYQGQITIDGREFWINAWVNKSNDGTKAYMSLKVKPKGEPRVSAPVVTVATHIDDMEIPF